VLSVASFSAFRDSISSAVRPAHPYVRLSVTATRRKSRVVTVRLNERDATALESIARQLDVDPITLIYRWIKEKLQAAAP
jgi:pantothenate kinase